MNEKSGEVREFESETGKVRVIVKHHGKEFLSVVCVCVVL